ncbi:type IV pilus secretin PilQ family protein [Nitrosomonas sp.]|uniref:type IV pilus secretin PilQ family protein n=1 Tax=Nitrosomonas sp. TaxID=42353 RepID=UPI0025FFAF04|nr:type IV pilus secretin PilQ family protein [Nitrosomonas sp.]MCC6917130.1 type IV pilus secretin PilQ family protein [Nitrosomonas sp.]
MNRVRVNNWRKDDLIMMTHRLLQNLLIGLLPVLWGVQVAAAPANTLRAVDITSQTDGRTIVRLTLDKPVTAPPAGVLLNGPDRLYFDLPQMGSALDKSGSISGRGVIKSIDVVPAEDRTRLVINLARATTYETRADGNYFLIELKGSEVSAGTAGVSGRSSASASGAVKNTPLSLRDIDFHRGTQGEGRVEVELSQPGAAVNVHIQGGRLLVEFMKTYLPPNLEKRLNVLDFATPVQSIEAFERDGNVQMIIEPKGRWEHTSWQTGASFVVEVRPLAEAEDIPIHKKLIDGGYTGDKLSLNFQDVEIRSVLQVIADFTDLNIIASDSVKGSMTLRLKDVPWDQALDIVLQTNGLDKRRTGNVIFIAPREEMAAREKSLLEQNQQITDLEVLQTEAFKLNYRTASSIPLKGILSQRGTVEVDDISNTLTVTDIPARLAEVARHVANLDTQVRQVMIETRIVEATDTFSRNLGARFGVQSAARIGSHKNLNGRNLGISGNLGSSSELAAGGIPGGGDNLNVNLPAAALAGVAGGPAALGLSLIKINNGTLINLELSALESDSQGRVIASPRLVTANRVEASIEQGTEIPFQTISVTRPQIQFKKAVLGLKVTPQITPDDNIIMKLQVNQDTRGENTPAGPAIDTKQIVTEVLVENGGTVVIGGIFEQVEKQDRNQVPLLGDIPVLGNLFKNRARRDDKRELLIFVTPRILNENISNSIRSALN